MSLAGDVRHVGTGDGEDLRWTLEMEVGSASACGSSRDLTRSASAVITSQPSSSAFPAPQPDQAAWKVWNGEEIDGLALNPGMKDGSSKRPTGLASIAVSESILVESRPNTWRCDCDMKYIIEDTGYVEPLLMFTAIEELQCCSFGSLQNIVIRDTDNLPVARVCYKDKSWPLGKLVMAVYAPVDLLLGTGEEFFSYGFPSSTSFQLRNADGEKLFMVEYSKEIPCQRTGQFQIISRDGNLDSARILYKSKTAIRLHFPIKTSLTHKIILLGFCISILHKSYTQEYLDSPCVTTTTLES